MKLTKEELNKIIKHKIDYLEFWEFLDKDNDKITTYINYDNGMWVVYCTYHEDNKGVFLGNFELKNLLIDYLHDELEVVKEIR